MSWIGLTKHSLGMRRYHTGLKLIKLHLVDHCFHLELSGYSACTMLSQSMAKCCSIGSTWNCLTTIETSLALTFYNTQPMLSPIYHRGITWIPILSRHQVLALQG